MGDQIRQALRSQRGFTLIETITAMGVFTLLCIGGLGLLVSAANSWNQDYDRASADTDTGLAMRMIVDELRPSISVMVDTNGQGLTYWRPRRDSAGHLVVPLQSDGVARRIWRSASGDSLLITGRNRALVSSLTPASGTNRLFTLLPSGKAIAVNIACTVRTTSGTFQNGKSEMVRLRNLE